ncbi:hypothetical protein Pmani_019609 [Petrolisthes manimaculis]|uniref:Uncharacterized protein n=1 Tax=Petrolisthes manimaculis TaxID=1843537 RepID=A0AAE1PHU6_9EUCA|nr:hypothetical protein Pmani_019609 [Petrolisthes manimaculis]
MTLQGAASQCNERGNTTSGYLLIQDARATDTGNYSCVPSNTAPATLRVHVLQDVVKIDKAHERNNKKEVLSGIREYTEGKQVWARMDMGNESGQNGETPAAMQTNGGGSLLEATAQHVFQQVLGVVVLVVLGYGGS